MAPSAVELTPMTSAIDLQPITQQRLSEDAENAEVGDNVSQLPPADTGKDAYFFLAGAFMIEALVWGFPFSFGTFQEYYSKQPQFASSSGVAAIGTTCSGLMYLGAPIVFTFLDAYPTYRRRASIVGLICCTIALLAASWANTVPQLIGTQGILYAVGGSLLYSPAIIYLDQWFIRRKGLAYGVMWAGTGVSGVVMPLVIQAALNRYGYRTVHRGSAVTIMVLSAPLLYYIKPRLPIPASSTRRTLDLTFLTSPIFLFLQLGNIIQGLGFFLPTIYLPAHASFLSLSPTTGSLLLSILNLASVFGQIFLGALSDRVHITTVILVSAIGAGISIFTAWGFAGSLAPLVVFALLYGFFAGGFTSTYTGCIKEVRKWCPRAEQGLVFGMFAAGRGLGNVICGPMSEGLLKAGAGWKGKGTYGTRFGGLVVVTGVTAVASVVSLGAKWRAGRLEKLQARVV